MQKCVWHFHKTKEEANTTGMGGVRVRRDSMRSPSDAATRSIHTPRQTSRCRRSRGAWGHEKKERGRTTHRLWPLHSRCAASQALTIPLVEKHSGLHSCGTCGFEQLATSHDELLGYFPSPAGRGAAHRQLAAKVRKDGWVSLLTESQPPPKKRTPKVCVPLNGDWSLTSMHCLLFGVRYGKYNV